MLHKLYELLAAHGAGLGLFATAVGSFAYAYLKHQKHEIQARVVQAAFAGVKKGLDDAAKGKDPRTALSDAIQEASKTYGVEDHVQDHVDEIKGV